MEGGVKIIEGKVFVKEASAAPRVVFRSRGAKQAVLYVPGTIPTDTPIIARHVHPKDITIIALNGQIMSPAMDDDLTVSPHGPEGEHTELKFEFHLKQRDQISLHLAPDAPDPPQGAENLGRLRASAIEAVYYTETDPPLAVLILPIYFDLTDIFSLRLTADGGLLEVKKVGILTKDDPGTVRLLPFELTPDKEQDRSVLIELKGVQQNDRLLIALSNSPDGLLKVFEKALPSEVKRTVLALLPA